MSSAEKSRVDFYKLSSHNEHAVKRFCCQLADKVVKLGHPVFVLTSNASESQLLDDMMWTFSDSSFLPHEIQDNAASPDTPVIIGHQLPDGRHHLLINLTDNIPEHTDRFERIAEIIDDDPVTVASGRARYASYNKQDYPLHYHDIKV